MVNYYSFCQWTKHLNGYVPFDKTLVIYSLKSTIILLNVHYFLLIARSVQELEPDCVVMNATSSSLDSSPILLISPIYIALNNCATGKLWKLGIYTSPARSRQSMKRTIKVGSLFPFCIDNVFKAYGSLGKIWNGHFQYEIIYWVHNNLNIFCTSYMHN